tara:strand:- start:77 stop:430 length:354 start_codon:yes stop_codon:yes gene_type:complete
MYNSNTPTNQDLPSTGKLIKSTVLAALVAGVLLVTVVMPSEYGIDPTGVGKALGLTEMGDIKTSLAEEAAADALAHAPQPDVVAAEPETPVEAVEDIVEEPVRSHGHHHGDGNLHTH